MKLEAGEPAFTLNSGKLYIGDGTVNKLINPDITDISGNAGTATKLKTIRKISLAGDLTGSANFDGSADVSISAKLANTALTAETGTGTAVDTPAVASNTFANILQSIWNKIRQVVNVLNGKQSNVPAETNGYLVTHSGTAGKFGTPVNHVGQAGSEQHPLGNGTAPGFSTNDFTAELKTKLDGVAAGANKITVENVLTSTSTANALSAAQGKALKDAVTAVETQASEKLPLAGGKLTGNITPSTNGSLSLGTSALRFGNVFANKMNLAHIATPTSFTNGDIWTTTAGLFARINGATRTVLDDNSDIDGGTF